MLTHYNLVANMCQMDGLDYFHRDDTLLCVLPLFHIYGLVVVLNMGLHLGATIVTMPRFDLERFLGLIQKYRVTLSHIVPPIVLKLAKDPSVEKYDLSSLKMIFSGAAPLGPELSRECMQRISCSIRQGYGMTETSPVTHSSPADPAKTKIESAAAISSAAQVTTWAGRSPMTRQNRPAMAAARSGSRTTSLMARSMTRRP